MTPGAGAMSGAKEGTKVRLAYLSGPVDALEVYRAWSAKWQLE
jgi:hypothetical protein